MRVRALLPFLILIAAPLWAQLDPVKFALELDPSSAAPGGKVVGKLTATIEDGWHLYAATTPPPTIPLRIEMVESPGIASWQGFQPTPIVKPDPILDVESQWYEHEAVIWIELETADSASGQIPVDLKLRYAACNDRSCLPPKRKTATAMLTIDPGAQTSMAALPDGYKPLQIEVAAAAAPPPATTAAAPASQAPEASQAPSDQGLFRFAAVAFGFGLLAVFTPCVFPMIPITMSYFVSTQSGEKKASLVQATTFVVGVIALFTGLGALVSVVLGPFGMQQLGSNVWVNLFIAIVFFAFGASLLGAFEITIPSGAMTKLDSMTRGGGMLSTLMMGLVFALASFACTGPFVGALLAGSVSGGGMAWPIFGMFMFSAGLALPFFGLALFPSYLSRMPKAGGWMTRIKIAMSFLILAAGFKYLSTVDQMYQWHLLTRERFLAVWIGLLLLDGLYLLSLLRLEDEPVEKVSLGRLAVGGSMLVVAVSLVPGMFGGHLGELEAYIPPVEYSGVQFAGAAKADKPAWVKDDYEAALAQARAEGKPLFVSFTGYSCTNCKWMKTNMFPRPEIAGRLDDFVLLELYTDTLDEAVADANQTMQQERFRTVAIPFYAILDGQENTIARFEGSTKDEDEFRRFLDQGSAKAVSAN